MSRRQLLAWRDPSGSFRLNAQLLYDRPPFLCIGLHKCAEYLRCLVLSRENFVPEIGDPRSDRTIGQSLYGGRLELGDDVSWRALRHENATPGIERKCR